MGIWDVVFLGNTISDYIFAVLITFILLAVVLSLHHFLLKYFINAVDKTDKKVNDLMVYIIDSFKLRFFVFLSIFVSQYFILTLQPNIHSALIIVFIIWISYRAIIVLSFVIDFFITMKIKELKTSNPALVLALPVLNTLSKIFLWIIALILILQNIGVDATALIAGLGVGGIAIALASKKIIADFFSAFVIFFDKPFAAGDFVTIGKKYSGIIEKIGLKTTQIRLLTDEKLIIPNENIVTTEIINSSNLKSHRCIFSIPISHDISEKLFSKIPNIIRGVIEKHDKTRPYRIYLEKMDQNASYFSVIFYISIADYSEYRSVQNDVLVKAVSELKKNKVKIGR